MISCVQLPISDFRDAEIIFPEFIGSCTKVQSGSAFVHAQIPVVCLHSQWNAKMKRVLKDMFTYIPLSISSKSQSTLNTRKNVLPLHWFLQLPTILIFSRCFHHFYGDWTQSCGTLGKFNNFRRRKLHLIFLFLPLLLLVFLVFI